MEEKLRRYVEELFAEAPPTKNAAELKEEMLQNLTEKYNDLIADGKTPETAYSIAVSGIGDVSGLFSSFEREAINSEVVAEQKKRSGVITALAVMLYILSALPLIVMQILIPSSGTLTAGLIILFVMVAAATGLLVYNNMTRVRYDKKADTMVEEFRQWQMRTVDRKNLRRAISAALWSIIIALYFIISFATSAWAVSWIIFVIAAALEAVITITFLLKKA